MSKEVIASSNATTEIKIFRPHLPTHLSIACLRVFIFCVRQALRRAAAIGCTRCAKILIPLKLHRESDLETPVAIFVLQVERYLVTTRTVVRAIEQAEAI